MAFSETRRQYLKSFHLVQAVVAIPLIVLSVFRKLVPEFAVESTQVAL